MEVGTCYDLRERCFDDLRYLWSIIRYSYFQFFPEVAFTEFDPEKNESEKKSWMLKKLAKEGWTPLPLAHDDSEKIYKEPELQSLLCILKKEADPDCIFPKLLAMLPFTERPEGQSRYSLPIENNIPGVVRYICIDFDRASDMDLNKFERVVDDGTQSGWEIYKDNLVTHVKNHRWEAESSERLIDFDTESLERSMSLETESQARSMSSETESFENSEPFKRSMSSETGSSVNNTPSPSPTAVVPRLRRRRRRSSRI